MSDIVDRLRDRAYGKVPDRLSEEAADEMERLRGDAEIGRLRLEASHAEIARLRLTDAEREAIAYCAAVIDDPYYKDDAKMAATLRGLLERMK